MTDLRNVSRRERQIMDIIFARGAATVLDIQADLPEAPSTMAIRRMLSILEEKGYLRRRKKGRQHVYSPQQTRKRAGRTALRHVIGSCLFCETGAA